MAVHAHAAASLCPNKKVFSCLKTVLLFIVVVLSHRKAHLFPRVSSQYSHNFYSRT